ncbi:MAG: type II toxin-antitoxin system HicA family toxin [Caldilineaceae bacterium]
MSHWNPCKRISFVRRLRKLGFDGPYSGTRHQFLLYGTQRLTIPSNPEYSVPQLRMMLREVGIVLGREITAEEWESLD